MLRTGSCSSPPADTTAGGEYRTSIPSRLKPSADRDDIRVEAEIGGIPIQVGLMTLMIVEGARRSGIRTSGRNGFNTNEF